MDNGPQILIGIILAGWLLGIMDTAIDYWIAKLVKREGYWDATFRLIFIMILTILAILFITFTVTGGALGLLFGILAKHFWGIPTWTFVLVGVAIGVATCYGVITGKIRI